MKFTSLKVSGKTQVDILDETETLRVIVTDAPKIKNRYGWWVTPTYATFLYINCELKEVSVSVKRVNGKAGVGKVYTGYAVRSRNCPKWVYYANEEFGPRAK